MKMNNAYMNRKIVVPIIVGFVMVAALGCKDKNDIIGTDPHYNGPVEHISCDPVPKCPQVCRFYVDDMGADTQDGLRWETALRLLQPAINKAHCIVTTCESIQKCEVWVAGTPRDNGTQLSKEYSRSSDNGSIRLRHNIDLYGGFEGTESTPRDRWFVKERTELEISAMRWALPELSAYDDGRIMEVEGNARIDGFIFSSGALDRNVGGNGGSGGGAVWAYGPGIAIANCYFEGNGGFMDGIEGGAILIDGGNANISDSVFNDNNASNGGAIALTGGSMTIEHCMFHDNMATRDGGAISKRNAADLVIRNSIFSNNHAEVSGGAVNILNLPSPEDLYSSPKQTLKVVNSLFMGNHAGYGSSIVGGGQEGVAKEQSIENSTFYNNMDISPSPTITINGGRITNSIAWSDIPLVQPLVVGLDVFHSVVKNWSEGETNIHADPMIELIPLTDWRELNPYVYRYRLNSGSPCIDSGDGDVAPEFDMAGNPRTDVLSIPNAGTGAIDYADIGAMEADLI